MISFSTILAAASVLLILWAMNGKKRRPLLVLPALLILAIALASRVSGAGDILTRGSGTFFDIGLALAVGAGFLVVRRRSARPLLFFSAASLVLAGLFWGSSRVMHNFRGADEARSSFVRDQFLLELGPDDNIEEIRRTLTEFDARAERAFPRVTLAEDENLAQYYIIHTEEERIEALMSALRRDAENVDHVERNLEVFLSPPDNSTIPDSGMDPAARLADDPRMSAQWGLSMTRGNVVHEMLNSIEPRKQAVVAILDTGIDSNHEDIRGVFDASPGNSDGNGHGTHCAGIAGAATNNGLGIASFNWNSRFVKIRGYRALGASGGGSAESVSQSIVDAVRDGADVVSLSLGSWSPTPPKVERDAVAYALRNGVIVVAAAGNSSSDAREQAPANIEGVIAVAAVDENEKRARFSNRNDRLDRPLAAPGVGILSLKPDNRYESLNGTSMATPFVSGLLGVLRAVDPALSADDAYALLHDTGHRGPDAGRVGRTINSEAAVRSLLERNE
jgi:thermitase